MEYGRRNIKPGYEFDKYFGEPDYVTDKLGDRNIVKNVIDVIPSVVNKYKYQTEKIANVLFSKDVRKFSNNIWDFLFNHIQYAYDELGKEQFRAPWYSWKTRNEGIDCDCFSIFVSCILTNKNIPHCLRITKYDNKPQWQHIYVIVPKPTHKFDPENGNTYWTIDAVIHEFNAEKEYSEQKTFIMDGLGVITEVLHGFDTENDIITEVVKNDFNGLGNAGPLSSSELEKIKKHLQQTKKWITENPTIYKSQGGDPVIMLKMLDYALDNFDKGEEIRNRAFEILAKNEASYNKQVLKIDDADLDGVIDDDDYQFSGIGELGKTKTERKAARQVKKATRQEKKEDKKEIRTEKKQDKKAERKEEKQERKTERQEAQGFFRKVGVAVKQGGEATFVKYNPAVIASRTAFLLAVKLNLFRLASRMNASQKVYSAVEKIFDDKLQGSSAELKAAVKIGMLKQGQDFKGLAGIMLNGLGDPATVASLLTAVPVLVSVINAINKVEDEEGVSGYGYIDDDVLDFEFVLNGFSELNGLAAAQPVTTEMVVAFIKKMFDNIKENREQKKGMTKEERKAYNKNKNAKRKTPVQDPEKQDPNSDMQKKLDDSKNGQPIDNSTNELVIDNPKTKGTGDEEPSFFQKNKTLLLIGGGGLLLAGLSYALSQSETSKQVKSLNGLEGPKSKTPKKSTKRVINGKL
ncbi:MAG: hypothetical protein PHE56_16075 [Bacteroidales bacterium]|nr:hypothetical protein [Bacteroidales bacterium]